MLEVCHEVNDFIIAGRDKRLAGPNYINLKVATPAAIDSTVARDGSAYRPTDLMKANRTNEASVRKESVYGCGSII